MSDIQVANHNPFDAVPPEVILEISTQLGLASTKSWVSFRQTCRRFRNLTANYEASTVKDIMARYPQETLERMGIRLAAPTYPSMHTALRRFATMKWIMSGVSYIVKSSCKAQPKLAVARFEEGLKLIYAVSDQTSYSDKVRLLHKMSITSLVSLWLALYFCHDEACEQSKGIVDNEHRADDADFRRQVEVAFGEEVLWQGPTFVYDTLKCVDRADKALQRRLAIVQQAESDTRDNTYRPVDAGIVYNELEDWLSGALGCDKWDLVYEAFYGM
ncbi:uncharacterized protein BDZ99DRAFT_460536 [Mytilinidion resinicola]|uniref:F-box domain-containing protein n=1 Tax=Mytilinidion resinicola TaxID=574789 RepID=A0A6A6YWD8_9PEZI|nr:uncharacterized protein BDZ99DRAFT_460536 [Mytilinidion resinicola]KAF2813262.1 hypothetical protein BDZ99DRAFT_460536 [Mytilinidion resinicola]